MDLACQAEIVTGSGKGLGRGGAIRPGHAGARVSVDARYGEQ
jgi:NAD(P)-dependent dehydrogenase (short-subunit alcohol dehydrogenase family)